MPLKLGQMLDSISDIYSSLAKAMECVSVALGPAILMGLVSSLLHLVATAYFLLVELVTKGFNPFTLVQFAWIGIHTTRMLLLVEPCHRAYYETQKTSDIISDGIRRPSTPEIKDKVSNIVTELCRALSVCLLNLVRGRKVPKLIHSHPIPLSGRPSWKCSGANFWFSEPISTLAECAKSIDTF